MNYKNTPILKDMRGKRIAVWVDTKYGGGWQYNAEANSELEFLPGALIIAREPATDAGREKRKSKK